VQVRLRRTNAWRTSPARGTALARPPPVYPQPRLRRGSRRAPSPGPLARPLSKSELPLQSAHSFLYILARSLAEGSGPLVIFGEPHPASRLRPLASRLSPSASGLSPLASGLSPLASRLRPPASRLSPPASRLSPPASGLSPLASRLSSPSSGLSPPASRLSPPASRLLLVAPRPPLCRQSQSRCIAHHGVTPPVGYS
jgi:hypothetical protein